MKEKIKNSRVKNIILLCSIFLIGFFVGGYYFQAKEIELIEGAQFSPFFQAWDQIQNKFYDYSENKDKKMLYGAIKGTIESLEDPYSDFLNPKEVSQLKEELGGTYQGIGAEITIKEDVLTIVAPLKNTPAEKAGLRANDKILEIDGKDTSEMTLLEAVMKIRGEAEKAVNLKIKRERKTFNVRIVRAKVKIPVFNFEMLESKIPYLQIFNFYENTHFEFEKAVETVLNSGADRMILDLRGNPGGFLNSAVNVGEYFVAKDKIILKQDFGKDKKAELIKSNGPGTFANFKVVILINEGSASAAEILAGAIKENNKKVILVGEKTFGKGTVQELVSLSDNSAIKITTAHWLLPNGNFIEEKGIKPDIIVKMTEDDVNKGRDPQLEKAKQIISK